MTHRIMLVGPINKKAVRQVLDEMAFADLHKGITDIVVEICSTGGDAKCGLAIAGRLRQSKHRIITRAYGTIESAATLIFAAGSVRQMSRMAWAFVHESGASEEGNSTAIRNAAKQMEREDLHWNMFMQEFTGTAAERWSKLDERDTYLTADECLKLNLATELI